MLWLRWSINIPEIDPRRLEKEKFSEGVLIAISSRTFTSRPINNSKSIFIKKKKNNSKLIKHIQEPKPLAWKETFCNILVNNYHKEVKCVSCVTHVYYAYVFNSNCWRCVTFFWLAFVQISVDYVHLFSVPVSLYPIQLSV